jgi:hypothetical protein
MLHVQSRKEICCGACTSEKLADKSWNALDNWIQELLVYSVELRTKRKVRLRA